MRKISCYMIATNIIIILLILLVIINDRVQTETITNTVDEKKYQVEKDITRPDIILVGGDITINENEEYKEPGYQAIDDVDGDITSNVEITSNLNNKKPGTYTITYSVSDSSGNKTEISRNIIVKEIPKPKPTPEINTNTNTNTNNANNQSTDSKTATKQTFKNTKTDNEEINNYIKELNTYLSKYRVSVGYVSLNNNFTYLYNENKTYFGASLIKTIDAMYIYENNITDKTLIEKVKLAISKSDNSAHAYLVKSIGTSKLKSYSKSIGVTLGYCNERFYCNTTVINQLNYLTHLYKLINTLDKGHELESYYINDYGNYLSFDKTYTNIHKYGNSDQYFHDVGIFKGENPYMIVVLTAEKLNSNLNYRTLISNISSKINDLNDLVNKE